MTQDEIIEMAKQALLPYYVDSGEPCNLMALERFALLVEQQTLESVAKEFDKMPFGDTAASFAIFVRNMKT